MAYRWNGVECDTFEELQQLQGSAHTTNTVEKKTRKEKTEEEVIRTALSDTSTQGLHDQKWIWCSTHQSALSDCGEQH